LPSLGIKIYFLSEVSRFLCGISFYNKFWPLKGHKLFDIFEGSVSTVCSKDDSSIHKLPRQFIRDRRNQAIQSILAMNIAGIKIEV
jgi:hypothetical protein